MLTHQHPPQGQPPYPSLLCIEHQKRDAMPVVERVHSCREAAGTIKGFLLTLADFFAAQEEKDYTTYQRGAVVAYLIAEVDALHIELYEIEGEV